jgi:predicted transcriptional regulator
LVDFFVCHDFAITNEFTGAGSRAEALAKYPMWEMNTTGGISIKTTIMRFLRHKHGVSLAELSRCAGVSPQYLSGIELGEYPATDNAAKLARMAFDRLIEHHCDGTRSLTDDYAMYRDKLLDHIEVVRNEL